MDQERLIQSSARAVQPGMFHSSPPRLAPNPLLNPPVHSPKVSIGLPVYNGENYLRLAVDSILDQDYGDFELIISDKPSTDGTSSICQQYAAQDDRIRYFRNETNIGAAANYARVFELAR